ncbi:transposase, IS605 OrfB family [Desulfurobacterium thermolithotrophum DSM 11699]|uniref:Transposase, IS605 OrfB family n=1 Tax=Desulfurobacterium thermolithotrophum (strain DSM 11699 / BSA) TaxID=868864 RepID=F0S362_DESTD|nr:IS200/IS605 family element RNA-guided endonuclease TnpB [Desulfurobacterium thermolithotrophum]ADY73284.1 transposase, IS605 OrfB family [Desulfurobacterium thermolithotrophum DSM 11699]
MLYVYRFRLYPKKGQVEFLNRQIGHCRFVYNKLLEIAKESYEKEGKKWNYYEYKRLLPKLKEEFPFLKEANSQSLQEAVKWLDRAFKNFFKGLAKSPRFKSKKRVNSVSIPQHFRIEGDKIKIPKLKTPIKFKKHREIEGKIKSISITKLPSGKFYLNVLVDREIEPLPETDKVVAIDVGLKSFCTLSTGEKIENLRHLLKTEKRLKKLQRKLSGKIKGSNKYLKLQKKIAKLHEKITNQRNDFLHKLSKRIVGDNQVVIVEDLNVKGLLQNGNLSKHIADASWRKFITYLEYKAKLYGRKLIKVNPFYPSSKLCSVCGYKNENLKLSDRRWVCPNCGTEHDRDYNAALNLLREGLKLLKGSLTLRAVGVERPELMPVESASALVEAGSSSFQ